MNLKKVILIITIFSFFSIALSIAVMISWKIHYEPLMRIIPESATMKFNTALLFLFSSVAQLISFTKSIKKQEYIIISFALAIISISGLTIISYYFNSSIIIDNFFVADTLSDNYPGRMSPATAFCFLCIGIGFLFQYLKIENLVKIGQHLFLITTLVSGVSIVSYLLKTPIENKLFFYSSMAIHTSILMFFNFIFSDFQTPKSGFFTAFNK